MVALQANSLPVRVDGVTTPLVTTVSMSPAERLECVLSDLVNRSGHGIHGEDIGMPSPGGDSAAAADSRAPSPVGSHVSGGGVLGGGVAVGLAYGMTATPSMAASVAASESGDAETARQDMQELRRHLAVLQNVQQAGTAGGMCEGCRAIQALMKEKPQVKQCARLPPHSAARPCVGFRGSGSGSDSLCLLMRPAFLATVLPGLLPLVQLVLGLPRSTKERQAPPHRTQPDGVRVDHLRFT